MPGWKKGALLVQRMVDSSTVRLRQLSCNRAEEVRFGRFLRNDRVCLEALNRSALARVGKLAAGCRHVLAIQDTTELNFQRHAIRTRGLGPVGNGSDQGLFLHPLLAIEAEGERCLGLAWAKLWVRPGRITSSRHQRPIAEKEAHRWLEGTQAAAALAQTAAMVTVVSDREADIFASWARPRPTNLHLLARAGQNRNLMSGRSLFAEAERLPVACCYCFEVPRQPGRPARQARMEVRFGPVELKRPNRQRRSAAPDSVPLSLIEVRECPCGAAEPPLHWRLLTTHRVEDAAAALDIVDWYRRRWNIEQLFWTLKRQGLNLEASQVESAAALIRLAFLASLAAARIMQLVRARDGAHSIPATEVFDDDQIDALAVLHTGLEGRTAKQKNPHSKGSLAWAAWIVARLGGWKGYASESPPGPLTMHHGLAKLDAASRLRRAEKCA
jgi:hypothetical protein